MLDTNAEYEIVTFAIGDTKAGTKMGKLQVKNLNDGSLMNCVLWEEALNRINPKNFRTANIIKITSASYNEKFNNCKVDSFEVLEEAKLGLEKDEREALYKNILETVSEFKDEKLKNFVTKTLKDCEEDLKLAPAAKLMHHNYIGGLLQHMWECLQYGNAIYPIINKDIDKDIMNAAIILHDIGKVYEYTIDTETGLIDYNEDFRKDWISHSQYGFSLCMSNGFKTIARMIAAHHGRTDWGAMIDLNERDLEPILYLTHHIDDLSAKFGKTSIYDIN